MKQLLPSMPRWQMLGLVAVLLVSFALQFYHNIQKTSFHIDENASLDVVMNAPNYIATAHQLDTWMTAKEFLTANHFIGKIGKKKVLDDLIQLRMNTGDSSHTNLYYLLLRLTIWTGVDSLEEYKWRGWALNFVLFAVGMLFLLRLFNLLYPDKPWLVLASTFLYAISVASSTQALFIRPYQLFGTALIILSFYITQALQKSEPKQDDFIKIALASFLALSSHYYSIIFIGLFGLAIIGYYLYFGQPKHIGFFLLAAFAGYVLSEIFYPYYTYGIVFAPNKHISHLASPLFFTYFKENFLNDIEFVLNSIKANLIYTKFIPILLTCILVHLFLIRKKLAKSIKISSLEIIVVITGIIYSFIVFYLSMYKEYRYMLAVTPFIFFIIPIFINQINNIYLLYTVFIIMIPLYSYKAIFQSPLPTQQDTKNIFYVNNPSLNVIIHGSIDKGFSAIDRSFLLPEYPSQQKYFFTTNLNLLKQKIQENRHGYLINFKENKDNMDEMGIKPGHIIKHFKLYWWDIYEYNLDITKLSTLEQ